MTIEHVNIAILGGGITGLGASCRARELSQDAVIFESRQSVGGLLDNFTIDGFQFDYAVHLSFANKQHVVRKFFDKTDYYTHPSDSFCFEENLWLKHPVQNNLFPLPVKQRINLIKSFLFRPKENLKNDYESWLINQYGEKISKRYPIRYTQKYWDTPAKNLSTSWIGNRMRRAKLKEVLFGALSPKTPNHYYTKEMRYPKNGGFKAFIQPLIDSSDIRTSHHCIEIDTENKELTFSNGHKVVYKNLVSTLPLPELVKISKTVQKEALNSAKFLKATSIDLISVGFNKPLTKDLWFYIYDEAILASRAYSPSIKSPNNAPKNCSSIQFEFYSRGTESKFTADELKANTLMALKKMKIAKVEDIVVYDHRRIKYGNVIFDLGMEAHRQKVLDWCQGEKIISCGRFGCWDYFWSHDSFLSGYQSLDKI